MNLPAAIRSLAAAGVSRAVLAAELGVHRTTVARWAAGTYQPCARNLAALKVLVDDLHRQVLAGDVLACRAQDAALTSAREALLTDNERTDLDRLAARLVADMAAYRRRDSTPDLYPHCLEDAA
jgi:transcriptional regulator with XRE-family HTH domain